MPFSQAGAPARSSFDKRALLRDHPLFGALGPEVLERLSAHAIPKKFSQGATIFTKGDPGTSLFAVSQGTVKISASSADGRDAVFNLVTEGAIFGEIALLDGRPRTADAIAVTDCELMVIERRDFVPLVESNPDVALKLIEMLCARLRQTTAQLEDIMFLDLPGRLARTLLRLAEGATSPQQGRIVLTQREIGQIIGMSRESTNKQLRSWERRKWIKLERGGIVLLARDALATIANTVEDDD
jgi:CRP/FNR family cyclic AMP-dependent transcriptional regulator